MDGRCERTVKTATRTYFCTTQHVQLIAARCAKIPTHCSLHGTSTTALRTRYSVCVSWRRVTPDSPWCYRGHQQRFCVPRSEEAHTQARGCPLCRNTARRYLLGASPLDPSRLNALRAVIVIHMLQADTRATPCSQPLHMQASAAA